MSALEAPAECPLCGALTEPEMDGDVMYYECENDECVGYAWGYTRTDSPDPDCAIGVPLAVRQQASQFDPPIERSTGVNLGTRIGLRPGL
jgi:hypothetical protein